MEVGAKEESIAVEDLTPFLRLGRQNWARDGAFEENLDERVKSELRPLLLQNPVGSLLQMQIPGSERATKTPELEGWGPGICTSLWATPP